jgi:hypothetical protein
MLSPASAFGFAGNFLFSYAAFLIWKTMVKEEVTMNVKQAGIFVLASAVSSLFCAATVGLGVWLFKLAPFMVVFLVVLINNTLMASVLGIILMKLLYKRVEKTGLLYRAED